MLTSGHTDPVAWVVYFIIVRDIHRVPSVFCNNDIKKE